jgi:hypothetical protein
MTSPSSPWRLDAVERILNRGGDADEALRQVVEAFPPDDVQRRAVHRNGDPIGELWTTGEADPNCAHASR